MKFLLHLLVAATVISSLSKANDFDYRYQSKWYDGSDECSFNRQSPIELNHEEAVVSTGIPALKFVNYNLPFAQPIIVANNGHSVNLQLPKPFGYVASLWQIFDRLLPTISGGLLLDGHFVTESVHFHWGSKNSHGSEHVIDNHRYSMEMHILHRNTKYQTVDEAKKQSDGLAVVAILYHVQSLQLAAFEGLENIIDSLAGIKEFNQTSQIENLNLAQLFGDLSTAEFYTYEGSLTTPPCSQAVQWFIFPQVLNISHEQMNAFRSLSDNHGEVLENNYRHLQPKGTRKVFYRPKENNLINSVNKSPPKKWNLLDKLKPQHLQNS